MFNSFYLAYINFKVHLILPIIVLGTRFEDMIYNVYIMKNAWFFSFMSRSG